MGLRLGARARKIRSQDRKLTMLVPRFLRRALARASKSSLARKHTPMHALTRPISHCFRTGIQGTDTVIGVTPAEDARAEAEAEKVEKIPFGLRVFILPQHSSSKN